jgi:hypothetical protein
MCVWLLVVAGIEPTVGQFDSDGTSPKWVFSQQAKLTGLLPNRNVSQHFLVNVFQQSWHQYPTATPRRSKTAMLAMNQVLHDDGFDMLMKSKAIDFRDDHGHVIDTQPPSWRSFMTSPAYTGLSVVTKPEQLDEGDQLALKQVGVTAAQRALARVFETNVTQHLYVSREGAMALQPHTDGGDVFVQQLAGQKHWTVCVPQPKGCGQCSDADKALLQELLKRQFDGEKGWFADNTCTLTAVCRLHQL